MKKKRKKPMGLIPPPLHYNAEGNFKESICPYCPYENPFYTHKGLTEHLLRHHMDKIIEGLRNLSKRRKENLRKPDHWIYCINGCRTNETTMTPMRKYL